MSRATSSTLPILAAVILVSGVIQSGCSADRAPTASIEASEVTVGDSFDAFWTDKGGLETFGPPLDPAHEDGSVLRQTFLNVELIFDPSATTPSHVYLAPLGRTLGLAEPPVPQPAKAGVRYFKTTGHTLFTGFVQAFDQLGGERVLGDPISEVAFRDGLVVQYFESGGLYREQSAAPSDVHLLALGLAAGGADQVPPPGFQAVLPPGLHPRPFGAFLDRYGGEAVFGAPLTDPHLGPDGSLEQVYEGAVLYSPSGSAAEVRLRALGRALGPAEVPGPPPTASQTPYFSETGHAVGLAFAGFYADHGGEDVIGMPLSEAGAANGVFSQRYENMVLEYRFDLPSALAVQLAPLGKDYLTRLVSVTPEASDRPGPTGTPAATETDSTADVAIVKTWVEKPILPRGAEQTIFVEVQRIDGTAWAGVAPVIVIDAPIGRLYPPVPLTNPEGLTAVTLKIDGITPGEIVTYDVAVAGDAGIGYASGQFAGGLSTASP